MKGMKNKLILGWLAFAIVGCGESEKAKVEHVEKATVEVENNQFADLDKQARSLFAPLPTYENNASDEIVALGKALYFEKRLSKDNTQSCNTCHNLNTFGVDNQPFSEGNDGLLGGRNSPTTLNAALHIAQFWDGREPDVEAQAGGPILNPVEMAMPSEQAVVERLSSIDEYVSMFENAFPDQENSISYENLKTAIGAFERKLITPSKFDDYLNGDDKALADVEKVGLQSFIEAGCIACHSGSLLGGTMYQKFGLFGNYWEYTNSVKIDSGRFNVTGNVADMYSFKVPSLRNVEKTFPYFHDGSVNDLNDAIRIMAKLQVNKELTEKEVQDIAIFLKSLTGNVPNELKE